MNEIKTHPIQTLGYNFIDPQFLPEGVNEYHIRDIQNNGRLYKALTQPQIEALIANRNSSDNWEQVLVSENFNPSLIKNCSFYGLVRIGELLPNYREFHNLRLPVGLYNSTIISCDIGDNVCIDNVRYLSHYIIEKDVMIANVNEFETTDYSKFGNGIIKEGEDERSRTWVEVCNENGGRSILPFNGMLPGDAYMWSKYRADDALMEQFKIFTQKELDNKRGYYGKVGERTVIKNCGIIKDVWIGSDAYLKGANKIKNVTINSDAKRKSQIGEGCELVNGIVGFGCRIFYGVKAVRFVLASHSQLKYGARLINSYLGNNSTISCCEVLNSLIFPSHEQHHNNSFLCAALIMGQSNIAAGATIGSNHNSRGADGEIQAGRGFWPGLCVSLKHNSKFASFTIIAKGDFPAELNIPIPFSLISNDITNDQLVVMPAYWFMYNMYALERNAWKYKDRDRRTEKIQLIEYDYLAPDTINEIFDALHQLQQLEVNNDGVAHTTGWENTNRKTTIIKVPQSIKMFTELIQFYAVCTLAKHFEHNEFEDFESFKATLSATIKRAEWLNIGGQLMTVDEVYQLKKDVVNGTFHNWTDVHQRYRDVGAAYQSNELTHAYCSLLEILDITGSQFTAVLFNNLLAQAIATKTWMVKGIQQSRAKDYTNPYRKMVYETNAEMYKVLGNPDDNSFIQAQFKNLEIFTTNLQKIQSYC
ncbi:DUF4954 family protein [Ferruginibacter yonginensis]|uniref:DUF4954 family protein n=1 Tax=Ferruginibacter yonginensis TaxID=1310416 RepID=A0ABV8QUD0_9BACT